MSDEEFKEFISNLSDRQFIAVFDVLNFDFGICDAVRLVREEMVKRLYCWFGDFADEK